jgi:hypothetical protein
VAIDTCNARGVSRKEDRLTPSSRFAPASVKHRPRGLLRFFLAATGVVAFICLSSPAATAHIRYSGGCDAQGYCEYFYGDTTQTSDHSDVEDPINIIWYDYGGWEAYIKPFLVGQLGWTSTYGGSQHNYRLLGSMSGSLYWGWAAETGQRASAGFPGARYHVRGFSGHTHDAMVNNWAVSGAHHEDYFHDIDRFWEDVENEMVTFAAAYGHLSTNDWSYLPRADGLFMGYTYSGWADRITPL